MILFGTFALPLIQRYDSPYLGRLFQPRFISAVARTAELGIPWAADNDAFQGFKEEPFRAMLEKITGYSGCRFVVAPDVVGDAEETYRMFRSWCGVIGDDYGLPLGFALQDGATSRSVPWSVMDAAFIGGSTEWKLSPEAEWLAQEAKDRGKWLHMGRVNSVRRIRRAQDWGCDSVDGSKFARFPTTWLPEALSALHYVQPELAG